MEGKEIEVKDNLLDDETANGFGPDVSMVTLVFGICCETRKLITFNSIPCCDFFTVIYK